MSLNYPALVLRVFHTGFYADGRPNPGSVFLNDLDDGRREQTGQNMKVNVYVPVGGSIDIPLSSRSLLSLERGSLKKFIDAGLVTAQFLMQFRHIGNRGGLAGNGVGLLVISPNVERVGGVARFVLEKGDNSVGYIQGERVDVSGLSGAFAPLNGTFEITAIEDEFSLIGANSTAFTISVAAPGPNIAAGADTALLLLPDFKTTVLFDGDGDAAGYGADIFGYVGGLPIPHDVGSGGGSGPILVGTFRQSFDDGDLTGSGLLTVSHNLGVKYNVIEVWDENDRRILPDFETAIDNNTITVDLTTFRSPSISGTWNVVILAAPIKRFELAFTSGVLVAGILTVTHNFSEQYNIIQVWDDSDNRILPNSETAIDVNTINVNLVGFTVSGTWRIVVLG